MKKGQILSIDAHNNSPDGDAIFSAHFCKDLPDMGPLEINYKEMNSNTAGWNQFYEFAADKITHLSDINDLISVTASCNGDGAVLYVF